MASMYSAKVMEHFANPHNVGELPDANGVGEVGNPKCGDIMRMYLKIENNVIVDVKFLTFGCGGQGALLCSGRAGCQGCSVRLLPPSGHRPGTHRGQTGRGLRALRELRPLILTVS